MNLRSLRWYYGRNLLCFFYYYYVHRGGSIAQTRSLAIIPITLQMNSSQALLVFGNIFMIYNIHNTGTNYLCASILQFDRSQKHILTQFYLVTLCQ